MTTIAERLERMRTNPHRRQVGQVPMEEVEQVLQYQRAFVAEKIEFQTEAIDDCEHGLSTLQHERAEAREMRQMAWEDHHSHEVFGEIDRIAKAKQKRLEYESSMVEDRPTITDKLNLAIEMKYLEFLSHELSLMKARGRSEYFWTSSKSSMPPLHRACKGRERSVIKLLLQFQAPYEAFDADNQNIFQFVASMIDSSAVFGWLLEELPENKNYLLLDLDRDDRSLLHLAALSGNAEILSILIGRWLPDIALSLTSLKSKASGDTALHLAALFGQKQCIRRLLDIDTSTSIAENNDGTNPLQLALKQTFNINSIIQTFLDQLQHHPNELSDSISVLHPIEGTNCLHMSIAKGFQEVTIQLISAVQSETLDVGTSIGDWKPIHLALLTQSRLVIKELLRVQANVDAVNENGQTPLLQACISAHYDIVRLLLDAGANAAHQNHQLHSALHYLASFCQDESLFEDIIAAGGDVNAQTVKLNTPLHFAAMVGNQVAVRILLAHGANPRTTNADKKSIVYLAKKWRHREVEAMIRAQADDEYDSCFNDDNAQSTGRRSPGQLSKAGLIGNQVDRMPSRSAGFTRSRIEPRPQTAFSDSCTPAPSSELIVKNDTTESQQAIKDEDDELIIETPLPETIATDIANSKGSSGSDSASPIIIRPPTCTFRRLAKLHNEDNNSTGPSPFQVFQCSSANSTSPLRPVTPVRDPAHHAKEKGDLEHLIQPLEKYALRIPKKYIDHRLQKDPVHVPWELTEPIPAAECQYPTLERRLAPTLANVKISRIRSHFANFKPLYWPSQANVDSSARKLSSSTT